MPAARFPRKVTQVLLRNARFSEISFSVRRLSPPLTVSDSRGWDMNVLQIEDDRAAAEVVEQILSARGHSCDTTDSGETAVKLASTQAYDIILLDIMLPDIDGYEVLKRMHAADVRTPVLIQTGLLSRNGEDGASLGAEDYLIKPYGQAEILEKIEALLAKDGKADTAPEAQPVVEEDTGSTAGSRDGGRNRRRQKRFKTLKAAQIIYSYPERVVAQGVLDCVILNLSAGGATLQPTDHYKGPETFALKIQYGPTHRCRICWKHGNKMGVCFLD